ncbi:MAG: Rrf2 family transcriptional regulator [Peptococcia bacterium]
MKFSTKARYGLRAMVELALNYKNGPLSVKVISERQDISEAYLEQLMAPLTRHKLAKSVRGAYGGYLLTKEPNKIIVGDIIRALEGPIAPVDCVSKDEPRDCQRADSCVTKLVWEKVRDAVEDALDNLTLEDLCQNLTSQDTTGK